MKIERSAAGDAGTNPATLIFLHIPKNAGRTFEAILERQYPVEAIYDIYGYGRAITDGVERLRTMPEEEKRRIRLIKGHYQYGLDEFLPQKVAYLTFLRDPVARVISHYHYVSRDLNHPLNRVVRDKNMSLADYVASGLSLELNNGQVRLLSGREHESAFGHCPAELLELAMEHMENNFSVVGLVERFDESLVLMGLKLGWQSLWYHKRNVRSPSQANLDPDSAALAVIKKYNELDLELYAAASRKLDRMIAECGPAHTRRLARLRRENIVHAPVALLARAMRYARKLKA
jgi:hypothetical protein